MDFLPAVRAWQLAGGRVVADMPFFLFDTTLSGVTTAPAGLPANAWGRVVDQTQTLAADIFGVAVSDFMATTNGFADRVVCLPSPGVPPSPAGAPSGLCNVTQPVSQGLWGELVVTTGTVRAWLAAPVRGDSLSYSADLFSLLGCVPSCCSLAQHRLGL